MKKVLAVCGFFLALALALAFAVETGREAPDSITVYLLAGQDPPVEFFSEPYAMKMTKGYNYSYTATTYAEAKKRGLVKAPQSADDFTCFHSKPIWWLMDKGYEPYDCAWDENGEWRIFH